MALAIFFTSAHGEEKSDDRGVKVTVSKARFHFYAPDGNELPINKIIGAKLTVHTDSGSKAQIRIDGAEPDPRDTSDEVVLYDLSVLDSVTGRWQPYCEPDPDGRRTGFPLPSQIGNGSHENGFFVTCTGGAYGKCIRFGYRPWRGDNGPELYRTCVQMVRADYCGNGIGHTRNGTPINLKHPLIYSDH